MKYEQISPISRVQADRVFAGGRPEEVVHALLGIAHHESDWEWAQNRCLALLDSPWPEVRDATITSLGHIARIHGKIDKARVLPALTRKLVDPVSTGRAEDAMEDIKMFASEPTTR